MNDPANRGKLLATLKACKVTLIELATELSPMISLTGEIALTNDELEDCIAATQRIMKRRKLAADTATALAGK